MRSPLFNWREIETCLNAQQIDLAFQSLSHVLTRRMKWRDQAPLKQRQLSDQLKIYFAHHLCGDHSIRLKLKFIRTLAFHPSLGDQKVQRIINDLLEDHTSMRGSGVWIGL